MKGSGESCSQGNNLVHVSLQHVVCAGGINPPPCLSAFRLVNALNGAVSHMSHQEVLIACVGDISKFMLLVIASCLNCISQGETDCCFSERLRLPYGRKAPNE